MDGNGRWATKKNLKRKEGHKQGIKNCIKLIDNLEKIEFKINELSFYVFSSENWKRSPSEIKNLFKLIEEYYHEFETTANKRKLKIRHFGSRRKLSSKILKIIDTVTINTQKNKGTCINLVFNYGSHDEIVNAFKKIKGGKISKEKISQNLYTANSTELDAIIRTGGDMRLSNFMLWQSAYSELFFSKKLWPDFKIQDLNKILKSFKKRKRNYGK